MRSVWVQTWIGVMCLLGLSVGVTAEEPAQAEPPARPAVVIHGDDSELERLQLFQGRSRALQTEWRVRRVSVTDEEVADVVVLSPHQVMVLGKRVGSTDVIIWGEDEEAWQARVRVVTDLEDLEEQLAEILPGSELTLREVGDTVVVQGVMRRSEHAAQLGRLLEAKGINYTDMSSMAGVQQVQVQVRIAEASRTAVRALGVDFFYAGEDFFFGTGPGADSPVNIGVPSGADVGDLPFTFLDSTDVGSGVSLFAGIPAADMQLFVRALAENQYMRILADPTLVALSGEEADFLAGGEFPIPVVQGGAERSAISIEYREFGVRLAFRPTVLGDGTIHMEVEPEVSELTDVGAVTIEGFQVPALVTRRASTTVELKSGQTFAMAGLLRETAGASSSQIPGLGSLPVLGPLFRSVRYERGETELVVLVTADLVEPLDIGARRPVPGDLHREPDTWELFLHGRLESERPTPLAAADAEWLRSKGLDRLEGPGAWADYEQAPVQLRVDRQRGQQGDEQEEQLWQRSSQEQVTEQEATERSEQPR